jgi:hypothetical protein
MVKQKNSHKPQSESDKRPPKVRIQIMIPMGLLNEIDQLDFQGTFNLKVQNLLTVGLKDFKGVK